MISYAKLDINFDLQAVKREALALGEQGRLHFNTMHYDGEWTVLSLRIPGGDNDRIVPDLMGGEDCKDTAYMQQCPAVKAMLNRMQCEILSVRFLNLKAGSHIKPHKDHELAFEHGEARLHFPIFTNAQVEFFIEDEQVRMQEGECWYINANLTHSVANKGNDDRIHLVVDCRVNDWLKQGFDKGEKRIVPDMQRHQLLQVIAELRSQKTELGNKLAAELEQQL